MTYTIVQHHLVDRDLFEIVDFIAQYSGLVTGLSKVDEIVSFIDTLRDYPHVGTVRNEIFTGLRAIPAPGKAVVCFTVSDSTRSVVVICVGYAGSDWISRVKERR